MLKGNLLSFFPSNCIWPANSRVPFVPASLGLGLQVLQDSAPGFDVGAGDLSLCPHASGKHFSH